MPYAFRLMPWRYRTVPWTCRGGTVEVPWRYRTVPSRHVCATTSYRGDAVGVPWRYRRDTVRHVHGTSTAPSRHAGVASGQTRSRWRRRVVEMPYGISTVRILLSHCSRHGHGMATASKIGCAFLVTPTVRPRHLHGTSTVPLRYGRAI